MEEKPPIKSCRGHVTVAGQSEFFIWFLKNWSCGRSFPRSRPGICFGCGCIFEAGLPPEASQRKLGRGWGRQVREEAKRWGRHQEGVRGDPGALR